ncbi:MAG: exosortase A [Gammaproteobacteria bacterium]
MSNGSVRYGWSLALPLTLGALALLALIYRSTLMSMIGIWLESDTFSHGFLVFPAVGFLIYRARDRLLALDPRPSWLGLIALLGCLSLWFVANVGSVQVAEQFAFVAALSACVWALLGTSVLRVLAFPILFSFFAVPFGDFIIPTLMQFTAWFVVEAIELTGIPVFREGYMLSIPRGDFEVAKACSGIRYLIASVSLGTFYAYITFVGWKKRFAFLGLAVAMPIIANGLRAFGIVMIAHFSDMQHAVGVDHLIYGWLFFGVLIFLMFWIGGRYADEPQATSAASRSGGATLALSALVGVCAGLLAMLVAAPVFAHKALAAVDAPLPPASVPQAAPGWRVDKPIPGAYAPDFRDANAVAALVYRRGADAIGVTVHTYSGGDREVVRAGNRFPMKTGHKIVRELPLVIASDGREFEIGRLDLLERGPRRAVLFWYQIGDTVTPSPTVAKIREWLARLSGKPTRRAVVSLSMPTDPRDDVPPELLAFGEQYVAQLVGCISNPANPKCSVVETAP